MSYASPKEVVNCGQYWSEEYAWHKVTKGSHEGFDGLSARLIEHVSVVDYVWLKAIFFQGKWQSTFRAQKILRAHPNVRPDVRWVLLAEYDELHKVNRGHSEVKADEMDVSAAKTAYPGLGNQLMRMDLFTLTTHPQLSTGTGGRSIRSWSLEKSNKRIRHCEHSHWAKTSLSTRKPPL